MSHLASFKMSTACPQCVSAYCGELEGEEEAGEKKTGRGKVAWAMLGWFSSSPQDFAWAMNVVSLHFSRS